MGILVDLSGSSVSRFETHWCNRLWVWFTKFEPLERFWNGSGVDISKRLPFLAFIMCFHFLKRNISSLFIYSHLHPMSLSWSLQWFLTLSCQIFLSPCTKKACQRVNGCAGLKVHRFHQSMDCLGQKDCLIPQFCLWVWSWILSESLWNALK